MSDSQLLSTYLSFIYFRSWR